MENHNVRPNEDNDLLFRDGLLDQLNKQKKIDQLLKAQSETPITEDAKEDNQLQYFTE